MPTNRIKTIAQLQEVVGEDMMNLLIEEHRHGDPGWLLDLIYELDYVEDGSSLYFEDFHGKLKGYKSDDVDGDAIYAEIEKLIKPQE